MATLTDAEIADIRHYAGYPFGQQILALNGSSLDLASLDLPAADADRLRTKTLPRLAAMEDGLYYDTLGGIDTAKASVWERNPKEIDERHRLYVEIRQEL